MPRSLFYNPSSEHAAQLSGAPASISKEALGTWEALTEELESRNSLASTTPQGAAQAPKLKPRRRPVQLCFAGSYGTELPSCSSLELGNSAEAGTGGGHAGQELSLPVSLPCEVRVDCASA